VARVAIVYYSATGTTDQLAQAVAQGLSDRLVSPVMCRIAGEHIVDGRFRHEALLEGIDGTQAVIWGSPTYMGGPAAQFKALADASSERWETQRWRGKLAAGFTTGSCSNGDQGFTLQYFHLLSMQHGMLWAGLDIPGGYHPQQLNRLGAQMGVTAQTLDRSVDARDLATARYLGERVAALVA
jgi:NAD(P)H dehydrogenase (quinone)